MHALNFSRRRWCGLLLSCLLAGCGGGPIPTYSVQGKVQFKDGAPATELAGRMITFQPVESINALPQGEIKPDASFELRTFKPRDGAPAGKYRVIIGADHSILSTAKGGGKPPAISKLYHDPKKSGLEVTVEPKSNQVTLTVERYKDKK